MRQIAVDGIGMVVVAVWLQCRQLPGLNLLIQNANTRHINTTLCFNRENVYTNN